MGKLTKIFAVVFALALGLLAVPVLHAQDDQALKDVKNDQPMMRDGMMGQGGMNNMMGMMRQMSEMMDQCNKMMSQGRDRGGNNPHEHKSPSSDPERKG